MSQIIIGAGLAGLIAACHFKHAEIFEAGPPVEGHKALLRFRDQSVSNITGIPFREVSVRKALYTAEDRRLRTECDIQMANLYSRKVSGTISGRSIWNLDPVKRYVAPEDFYPQLLERHGPRIHFNTPVNMIKPIGERGKINGEEIKYISTMPLSIMAKIADGFKMKDAIVTNTEKAAIRVDRYRIPHCDVYQTIYFPEHELRVFRASITGDILIVESIDHGDALAIPRFSCLESETKHIVLRAFGIEGVKIQFEETVDQKYGKIVSLPSDIRHAALYELTRDYGVYSLGRFATWRNILLDDVVKDIHMIDMLMKASEYSRHKLVSAMVNK